MQGASEGDLPRAGGGGGGGRGRGLGAAAPPAGLEGRQRGARAALGALTAGTARLLPAALLPGAGHVSTRPARGPRFGRAVPGGGQNGGLPAAPRRVGDPQTPPGTAWQFYEGRLGDEDLGRELVPLVLLCGGTWGPLKAWLGLCPGSSAPKGPADRHNGRQTRFAASRHVLSYTHTTAAWAGTPQRMNPALTRGSQKNGQVCVDSGARSNFDLLSSFPARNYPGNVRLPRDAPGGAKPRQGSGEKGREGKVRDMECGVSLPSRLVSRRSIHS